jgi:hypothetical protein
MGTRQGFQSRVCSLAATAAKGPGYRTLHCLDHHRRFREGVMHGELRSWQRGSRV